LSFLGQGGGWEQHHQGGKRQETFQDSIHS
jgi:hypothetical protein